jgi:hypothetical protein
MCIIFTSNDILLREKAGLIKVENPATIGKVALLIVNHFPHSCTLLLLEVKQIQCL